MDFRDIKGQEHVKRGLEVAVTGGHNVMLIGTRSSLLAKLKKAAVSIEPEQNRHINIGTMLTCPCGNFTDPKKACKCSPFEIQKYIQSIVSDPTYRLDTVDIHLEVPALNEAMLTEKRRGEPSDTIKERIIKAQGFQQPNAVPLDKEAEELFKLAILELGISSQSYDKIYKVAATICRMDSKDIIEAHHISEAISYRSLDRNLWS